MFIKKILNTFYEKEKILNLVYKGKNNGFKFDEEEEEDNDTKLLKSMFVWTFAHKEKLFFCVFRSKSLI